MSAGLLRRVSVRVPVARGEEARAAMIELFPDGFEEVDADRELEFAAYTNAGGEERLWQVFGPGGARDVAAGWADAWKSFHRPVRIGPLWIGPPWETPDPGAMAVIVDPGRAFGTGAHPTTRLCLQLLLEQSRSSVIDVGTGSGVLAIAAAKLGFDPVVGLDLDEAAVESALANAAANGVSVDMRCADVFADPLPPADLAVANISLEDVERLGARLRSRRLIVSGYLASARPALPGWSGLDRRETGGWAADLVARVES
jgi:ribosomal protein L11 methyltransferase